MAQFFLKIAHLSFSTGPTPILKMAVSYGLHPRLWLLVHDDVFSHLAGLWGPHTIERFSHCYNTKLLRFNLRFLQPGSKAVDVFSQDWSSDNNCLVPPIAVIGKVLSHMRD